MRSTQGHRWIRVALTALVVMLLVAQTALGGAYSPQTYVLSLDPAGSEPGSDYCSRAGIVDTARNYSLGVVYLSGGNDRVGTTNQLSSGWLAVRAQGYRDGASCGYSSWYYTTEDSATWQLWITPVQ